MIQLGALLIEHQCDRQSSRMWVQPNWLKFASKPEAARNFEVFLDNQKRGLAVSGAFILIIDKKCLLKYTYVICI